MTTSPYNEKTSLSESDDLSDKENYILITENDIEDLKEYICSLIDEYYNNNIIEFKNADFIVKLTQEITNTIECEYKDIINFNTINIGNIIDECVIIYFNIMNTPRSYDKCINDPLNKSAVTKQLKKLRSIPQPPQNTNEWFEVRWTKLTASSIWKCLGSECMKNSLIYAKCKPFDASKYTTVNVNSATHHGHKFEPISTAFYENKYDTIIEEFGCIPDDKTHFLAASPDGINIKKNSNKYGYLLEIKNPVSRKLNGTPKMEYWIQMQLQMYTCKLYKCDFLETVFKEYDSEEEFYLDGEFNKTKLNKLKGIILCFNDGSKPIYKYPKVNITKEEFEKWYEKTMDENNHLTWVNNTYWYMENYSCITVPYNKEWFNSAFKYFKQIWDTIEKERVSGYEHRKPKEREKKPPVSPKLVALNDDGDKVSVPLPPKITLKLTTQMTKL